MEKKITAETKFPRSWTLYCDDGDVYYWTCIPLVTGVRVIAKTTIGDIKLDKTGAYHWFDSLMAGLDKDPEVKDIVIDTVGNHLSAEDIEQLNKQLEVEHG